VAVVGCSGSGKTRLATALAQSLGCPHVELDAIFHQPGWTPLGDDEFRRRVQGAVDAAHWVVDGNYSVVRDIVWGAADTVVWVDLPFPTVMSRVIRRTLRRVVSRTELWNGNREPWSNLWSLNPQRSIIAWSATRHRVYRARYAGAERDPRWAGLTFIRLRSQQAADQFLHRVRPASTEGGGT
jgi:adenylate kinase family enzyme